MSEKADEAWKFIQKWWAVITLLILLIILFLPIFHCKYKMQITYRGAYYQATSYETFESIIELLFNKNTSCKLINLSNMP